MLLREIQPPPEEIIEGILVPVEIIIRQHSIPLLQGHQQLGILPDRRI